MSVSRRLLHSALALIIAGLLAGCPPSYVNKDGDRKQAMLLPSVEAVPDPDGLDVDKGDISDWKYIEPARDGKGWLKVHVGDPFAGDNRHGIPTGRITVRDANAQLLAEAGVVSGKAEYILEFPVSKGTRVYLLLEASEGKDAYQLTFEVRDAACKDCAEDEVCKNGQCVEAIKPPPSSSCPSRCRRGHFCLRGHAKREARCVKARGSSDLCSSECTRIYDVTRKFLKINYGDNKDALQKRLDGLQKARQSGQNRCTNKCESGAYDLACLSGLSNSKKIPTCKVPCGGECKRGSRCNEATDTCERTSRKCKKCKTKCPDDHYCQCKTGKCVKKRTTKPEVTTPEVSPCSPPCSSKYRCDAATKKCKPKLGPIGCRIFQVSPSGGSSLLTLSRGRNHFVAKGDKGSVPGIGTFVVTEVFAKRSRARIKKAHTALAGAKKCSINRKNYK